jgi:hypothetical protein
MSPERSLDQLLAMATDARDGVVLGADGRRLAGSRTLAAPARELLAAAGDAADVEVATGRGTVYAARRGRRTIAVVASRSALPALMRHDLHMSLRELSGR